MLGDSIAAQATAGAASWFTKAARDTGGRVHLLTNHGSGGKRTDEILTTQVPALLAGNPAVAIVQGGGNDITQAVSAAAVIANLDATYRAVADGRRLVIATPVCPSSYITTADMHRAYDDVNAWIRAHAGDYPNTVLCDWDAAIREPGAYTWKAALTSDGAHPSIAGEAAMAGVLTTALTTALPPA